MAEAEDPNASTFEDADSVEDLDAKESDISDDSEEEDLAEDDELNCATITLSSLLKQNVPFPCASQLISMPFANPIFNVSFDIDGLEGLATVVTTRSIFKKGSITVFPQPQLNIPKGKSKLRVESNGCMVSMNQVPGARIAKLHTAQCGDLAIWLAWPALAIRRHSDNAYATTKASDAYLTAIKAARHRVATSEVADGESRMRRCISSLQFVPHAYNAPIQTASFFEFLSEIEELRDCIVYFRNFGSKCTMLCNDAEDAASLLREFINFDEPNLTSRIDVSMTTTASRCAVLCPPQAKTAFAQRLKIKDFPLLNTEFLNYQSTSQSEQLLKLNAYTSFLGGMKPNGQLPTEDIPFLVGAIQALNCTGSDSQSKRDTVANQIYDNGTKLGILLSQLRSACNRDWPFRLELAFAMNTLDQGFQQLATLFDEVSPFFKAIRIDDLMDYLTCTMASLTRIYLDLGTKLRVKRLDAEDICKFAACENMLLSKFLYGKDEIPHFRDKRKRHGNFGVGFVPFLSDDNHDQQPLNLLSLVGNTGQFPKYLLNQLLYIDATQTVGYSGLELAEQCALQVLHTLDAELVGDLELKRGIKVTSDFKYTSANIARKHVHATINSGEVLQKHVDRTFFGSLKTRKYMYKETHDLAMRVLQHAKVADPQLLLKDAYCLLITKHRIALPYVQPTVNNTRFWKKRDMFLIINSNVVTLDNVLMTRTPAPTVSSSDDTTQPANQPSASTARLDAGIVSSSAKVQPVVKRRNLQPFILTYRLYPKYFESFTTEEELKQMARRAWSIREVQAIFDALVSFNIAFDPTRRFPICEKYKVPSKELCQHVITKTGLRRTSTSLFEWFKNNQKSMDKEEANGKQVHGLFDHSIDKSRDDIKRWIAADKVEDRLESQGDVPLLASAKRKAELSHGHEAFARSWIEESNDMQPQRRHSFAAVPTKRMYAWNQHQASFNDEHTSELPVREDDGDNDFMREHSPGPLARSSPLVTTTPIATDVTAIQGRPNASANPFATRTMPEQVPMRMYPSSSDGHHTATLGFGRAHDVAFERAQADAQALLVAIRPRIVNDRMQPNRHSIFNIPATALHHSTAEELSIDQEFEDLMNARDPTGVTNREMLHASFGSMHTREITEAIDFDVVCDIPNVTGSSLPELPNLGDLTESLYEQLYQDMQAFVAPQASVQLPVVEAAAAETIAHVAGENSPPPLLELLSLDAFMEGPQSVPNDKQIDAMNELLSRCIPRVIPSLIPWREVTRKVSPYFQQLFDLKSRSMANCAAYFQQAADLVQLTAISKRVQFTITADGILIAQLQ